MENAYGRMRTNYFKVTDTEKLKKIVSKCQGTDGEKVVLFDEIVDGEILYGFGCSAHLQGYYDEETENYNYDDFLDDLQTVVAPGDAVIIMEIGYDKMRYVYGLANIVTSEKAESMDFTQLVIKKAAELLSNPDYKTKIEY
ncbi:MAG: hypothetical protein LBI03_05930 [Clostridiales bacterium]|jgi:hypothetical protein|nr:hypothetical protein [Clostridiales bacterium]